ncbi:MAG: hypothetical protein ACXWTY_00510, partial [Methylobacter sp.]
DTLFYRNTALAGAINPTFVTEGGSTRFGLSDVGTYASPTLVDIDRDGDLDAIVGNGAGNMLLYRNTLLNNTAPTATNLNQTIAYTEDTTAAIADIVITDPDATNPFTATVTLAGGNSAIGSLSASSGNGETYSAATGMWTVAGTKTAVNAALASLSFVPVANGFANTSASVSISDGIAPAIIGTLTFNGTSVNDAPTLTNFGRAGTAVAGGDEDSVITVTFANHLMARGNEGDIDGNVTAFVIKAISSGSLKIGASLATATAWAAGSNDVVDVNHQAIWTPGGNNNGLLNAFTAVAKDDGGLESATAIQVRVSILAVNDAPVLGVPTDININDTIFDDTFQTVTGGFFAFDIDNNNSSLSYGIVGGTDNGDGTISTSNTFGVLTMEKATGDYSFAPIDRAIESLTANVTTTFTVSVADFSLSSNQTLTINILQNGTTESEFDDTLTGTATINKFNGLAGDDIIIGLGGADTLKGGADNDTLNGGKGNDTLTGGTGFDLFRFNTAPIANIDKITDFKVVDDTIQLENAVFTKLITTGVLDAANFAKAAAAIDGNDYVIYNPASGALLYDADGNGAGAAVQIATLGVNLLLTNADFAII